MRQLLARCCKRVRRVHQLIPEKLWLIKVVKIVKKRIIKIIEKFLQSIKFSYK